MIKTMNAVPNLSQKPLRLRAMAAPSGTPMSTDEFYDAYDEWLEQRDALAAK